ncbi:hypothetical protein BH23ACT2_BH23ACT2_07490 [soil metagenome]
MATETRPHGHARPGTRGELALYAALRVALVGFGRVWFRLRVDGRQHVPEEGAFILAPSHRSNIDFLLVLVCTRRRMRFLAKDSLWKGPWARLFSALGGIPVSRGNADREALRTCVEVVAAGEPLVVFPEGARQSGAEVQDLFDGPAFVQSRTGAPILPVGIGGSEAAMPKGSRFIRPHKVQVVVGPAMAAPAVEGTRARRSAVRARTAELYPILQELFDRAQARAGTPNR